MNKNNKEGIGNDNKTRKCSELETLRKAEGFPHGNDSCLRTFSSKINKVAFLSDGKDYFLRKHC